MSGGSEPRTQASRDTSLLRGYNSACRVIYKCVYSKSERLFPFGADCIIPPLSSLVPSVSSHAGVALFFLRMKKAGGRG